jgi:hypothetical protein
METGAAGADAGQSVTSSTTSMRSSTSASTAALGAISGAQRAPFSAEEKYTRGSSAAGGVDGLDDLGVVDALQVDRRDAEVLWPRVGAGDRRRRAVATKRLRADARTVGLRETGHRGWRSLRPRSDVSSARIALLGRLQRRSEATAASETSPVGCLCRDALRVDWDSDAAADAPYIATMASTTDTHGVRLRVVFAERQPSRTGVDLSDLESAFVLLDALFKVAWAISDPETLRIEAEFRSRFPHGSGGEALLLRRFPPSALAPLPNPRSLVMQSRLDLIAEIPREFVRGGGPVAALGVLIERVLDFPVRIQVQREKLLARKAAWEAARTRSELLVIAGQAQALQALDTGELKIQNVELLDSDDNRYHSKTE